ncbi:MAG: Nif3-like dinuclear metal center hexameric protein [Epsilonproteobacteria bacterium]|nr:Nif3-like dinuclear metal center hexameric protein [Campylobacterota bacterium]
MKIQEIYDFLDDISPFSLQEAWDNSGLIIGNMDDEFSQVYISLDIDFEVLNQLSNGTLLITHHPLIFSGLKKINFDSYSTKLLQFMIKKDIKLISMHTNIDKTHLNRFVMEKILGFDVENEDDFIYSAKFHPMHFDEFYELIKNKLGLEFKKVVKCSEIVSTFALTTGSGMSLLPLVKSDVFLTGDIKYHDAMDAKIRNISLIDIGHYESEIHFNTVVYTILEKYLKKNKILAIMGQNQNPFEYK